MLICSEFDLIRGIHQTFLLQLSNELDEVYEVFR